MEPFTITFNFPIKEYSATVRKHTTGSPVQFHVEDIEPADFHIPIPYVFSIDAKTNEVHFPSHPEDHPHELGNEIWSRIVEECQKKGISFID